ncbi:MAG: S-layer homology domain-containing protein [Vallitalea sp.]|jgi:hypothetical protein|nr:S-layer homology domain-containing protein [Vallitalea sp.]
MYVSKIKKILSLIVVICLLLNINIYASEDSTDEAINYINNIREELEIRTINFNKELTQSAEYHSKYMSINDNFSTIEESGNKYYKGRYSWDRASYNKYFNPYIAEFISNTVKTKKEGIIDFINNPYSRIVFLDPLYNHIGIGQYEEMYTFDLGGKSRVLNKYEKIAIYPYDNMENVPVKWENHYKIDPYKELKGDHSSNALPITLSYYSDKYKIKAIYSNEIELINLDTKEPVETKIILPQDDKNLDNSLIILPLESLEYNTTYEVRINVDYKFENNITRKKLDYKVNFSTQRKEITLNRGKFTEYLVKSLDLEILNPKKIFKDIDIELNNAKYIYTAYKNNLISGYGDNTFRADLDITKEQVLTILVRAYEKNNGEIKLDKKINYYNNEGISKWAIEYIMKAEKLELITNKKEVNYQDQITYSQYQDIIKLYKKIVEKEYK